MTQELKPIIHAKWQESEDDFFNFLCCSECGTQAITENGSEKLTPYCPWCGAKMDNSDYQ